MKTFALALCILVLALAIHDISARPHRRGPQGQRGQGQRGQGQRGQGQRGQGQRGQQSRRHRGPRGGYCRVFNGTTLEVLCDNSARCPDYTVCSPPPADVPQPPPTGDLVIHNCIPKVCDPEDPAACPTEATCAPLGTESRCIPTDQERPRRRHRFGSSSEESSEESVEDLEENEVEEDEDEDTESCREIVMDVIGQDADSRERGGRSRGRGGRRLKFKPCLITNTTSNTMLCHDFMSCPEFTQCLPTSADKDRRHPVDESLSIHVCRPMNCTEDGSICPTNTTCQQHGATSWCLPEGRRQGRRDHDRDEQDEVEGSCKQVLKDIFRQSKERRPSGRRPTADGSFGQGEGGNGRFGQGRGDVDQGDRANGRFGPGQNGAFGSGPLRQGRGPFGQGQLDNGGLDQEPENDVDLDVEEEDSSSSEERPRGNRGNRPSARAFGQRRGRRQP